MSGRAKRFTLARVPVSLKGKRWKLARSLCDSGSIANTLRLLPARVEEKRHPALIRLIAHRRSPRVSGRTTDFVDKLVGLTFGNMAYDAILDGKIGLMTALVKGCYELVPIPDPQARAAQGGRRHSAIRAERAAIARQESPAEAGL